MWSEANQMYKFNFCWAVYEFLLWPATIITLYIYMLKDPTPVTMKKNQKKF